MVGDYEDFRRMHNKMKHQLFTERKGEMKSDIWLIVGNKVKTLSQKGFEKLIFGV
jgi:hypothetical protein